MKTVHRNNVKKEVNIGKKWKVLLLQESPEAIIIDLWSDDMEYPNQYRLQLIHNAPHMNEADKEQVPKHIQREVTNLIRSNI